MEQESTVDLSGERSTDAALYRYVVPELTALLRVARTLTHNPDDAEDLVQDTIMRAYTSIATFDGAHPRAWLFTILRNTHINRNRRRQLDLFDDPNHVEAIADHRCADPAELAEQMAFRDGVVAAIVTLPEKMRVVVELVDLESCTYVEVAMALGIPIGTVMSRLHRGRKDIKSQLVAKGLVNKKVSST